MNAWRMPSGGAYFSNPGKPMQNGYIESFNGKLRSDAFKQHWFPSCPKQGKSLNWRHEYKRISPSSLDNLTPEQFALKLSSNY
jgi:putative transposase